MDMDLMSIAYAFSDMKQIQVQSEFQTQVLRNAMDTQTQMAQDLLQVLAASAAINPPYLGNNLDVYA